MSVTTVQNPNTQADRKKLNDLYNERKTWFRIVKKILRLFVKEPRYIFLGDKAEAGSIILTNHVGPSAPITNELYSDMPVRLWGAHEMNVSFKSAYKYQTEIYYHQKKHWNIYLAKVLCLIITPLTYMYYKGINLISSYGDVRFRKTLSESLATLESGTTVVIFPEKSDNGYFKVLTGFYPGAVMFLQYCQKHGINAPVFVAYLNKETRQYIFDTPKTVDELLSLGLSRTELADMLCARCNELGTMKF
ncbi:MAG: hypothetical protein IJ017_06690 [Oscillospiraceae bacterium]|nr:hypothetical protein [Oscillospiraceae bacterium]